MSVDIISHKKYIFLEISHHLMETPQLVDVGRLSGTKRTAGHLNS